MAVSRFRTQQMAEADLLAVATNLLIKSFLECPRVEAKRRYRALDAGKRVLLTELRQDDGGRLRAVLSLDRSELRGKLNFGLLRDLVARLVSNFATALQQKQPLQSFSDGERQRLLFLLPAAVEAGDQADMLVLCLNVGQPGELGLELLFIDPEQFTGERTAG